MARRSVLAALPFLAAALVATSALASPQLTAGTGSGSPGETVNIAFTFTNDSSITGLQFDVLFDSSKVASVGTPTEGSALASTDHEIDSNLVSAGRFRVLVYSNSLAVIPSGQLVVIPFTLAGNVAAGTTISLTLSDVEFVEANALVIPGTVTHGQITVEAAGCAVPGDVAPDGVGNGAVSTADFVVARRKATGVLTQNQHDAECGNVYPGVVACTPQSGKVRWCPSPNGTGNPISLGDVVVIRRLVVQTYEISCVACAGQTAVTTRPAGDLSPRGAGDGRVDIGDVVLALRTSVGLEPVTAETTLADVSPARHEATATFADGNGTVDVGDVVLLLRTAVGLETLTWPQRSLDVTLAQATPRVAYSLRVGGWPAFAQVQSATGQDCGSGDDSGLDLAVDRFGLTCASDPSVETAAGTLATITYVGPRVATDTLSIDSSVVAPDLSETPGLLGLTSH